MDEIIDNYLIIATLILASLVVLFLFGTVGNEFLAALLYPIEVEETELRPGNVLVVESFVDGEETPGAQINQVPYGNLNSNPESGLGGSTSYERRGEHFSKHDEWPEIKNIVLRAQQLHGGGYFVGWSGCDATDDGQQKTWEEPVTEGLHCQISITDSQIRKVEAHYARPNEELDLQIFSISKNPLGGTLNDSWLNTRPELIYKASYIELDNTRIPDSIGELSVADELQLNLGGNQNIYGQIPEETDNLGEIDYLGLYKGSLDEEIPENLGLTLRPIYFLAYMNQLPGEIPENLGEMGSRPGRFELHDNRLEGEVPHNLYKLTGLEPREMRLYINQLESTEDDLIYDSNWEGVNFNTNVFSTPEAMDTLDDASRRSGTYIDFCNNPADGGRVRYDLEGNCVDADIRDEVNAAVEAGWDVYIRIELEQLYDWYDGCSSANCSENYDDDGECESASRSGCNVRNPAGYKQYCHGDAECVRIEEPIESCDDIEASSEGLPEKVIHASRCPGCEYYTHPQCEPDCEFEGECECGVDTLRCEESYPRTERDEKGRDSEEPPRSTDCMDVQKIYQDPTQYP